MKVFPVKYIVKRLFAVVLLTMAWGSVSAQVTGDQYTSSYSGTTVTNVSITHKSPKWTQYHEGKGYNDTYNEADMITLENGAIVQAANAYVDTIYVHKGTSVTLTLPYRVADSNASIYNYLRWFDYRTDGNFNCAWGNVYDLLTPALSDRTTYRFANGYATINGSNGSSSITKMNFYYPTDTEFDAISGSGNFIKTDNDYYIVACDASIYTDFTANNDGTAATFGSTNSWCEPTLASRAIYYIVGVEDDEEHEPAAFTHYWELRNTAYQGGTNTGDEHYIDEYEITYPTRRFSNNTAEMVALTKDANAYAIPGTSASDDPNELDVTLIEEPTLGFSLTFSQALEDKTGVTDGTRTIIPPSAGTKGKISGNNRVIFFYKGELGGVTSTTAMTTVPTDTQWYVADGSTITILVTKTVGGVIYNLARYKVTFSDDANLLTQTQVAGLSSLTGNEGYWWNNQTNRSPEYMEEYYTQVASLLFDYDTAVNAEEVLPNGQEHFYPFPMDWTSNGYAFFDGVAYGSGDANTTFDSWNSGELRVGTRFSMYSITNEYIGYWDSPDRTGYASPPTNLVKDDNGYWLYIDASERPGAVAELTIDGNLCAGSKLFGTAWIKGAGGNNSVDAGALFSIGGVNVNADGTETHTAILRQATGQVRVTTRITEDDVNEQGLSSDITGKGADTNEWFQVYFSFVTSGETYDYYTLRVDNYCAGTDGGDYYFDELKVYVETPTVEVEQLTPICTDPDARSHTRFDLDYETMISRLGIDPSDYVDDDDATASVDLIIFNRAKYYNYLAAVGGEPTQEDKEAAMREALVSFYSSEDGDACTFPTIDFYINYEKNREYDTDNVGGNLVDFDSSGEGFFYRRYSGSILELSMDVYSDMQAFTDYILLLEPHTETDKSDAQKLDEFITMLDDECAIRADIFLTSTISLMVNGQLAEALQDYCAGQFLYISPFLTYTVEVTDENTGEVVGTEELYINGVYYDWFFGSKEEYTEVNTTYGTTLQYALTYFRSYYPDAEELDPVTTPPTGAFTQAHYNIIEYYLNASRTDGGEGNRLVLHTQRLEVRMLSTGLEIVIQPIKVEVTDENGETLDLCFGYSPLTLMSSGEAPTLRAGFSNINYPSSDFEPCLRLGLAQLTESEDAPLIVNLCDATYTSDEYVIEDDGDDNYEVGEVIAVDHLGVAENDGLDRLFLIDSNDPYYQELVTGPEFDQYSLPVGKIVHLYARDDDVSDDASIKGSYMKIYFYDNDSTDDDENYHTQFIAKEGYYYVMNVYFEEEDALNVKIGNACQGVFSLEVKVVPEYLVWKGEKTYNWNNDKHWYRADKSDLNKPDTDPYITNEANGTDNGFVPMLFTKVIIPREGEAELYMAGFAEESDGTLSWTGDEDAANHNDVAEHPTSNIMYDMMVYEEPTTGTLKTEHYRVNLCDEIHLEPGAELLHAEQLIYNKAWTEVEIPEGEWLLTAMPLQDVVSGDWYTKTATGTETDEYFTDITFSATDNDRYEPLVYQRNWSTGDKVILSSITGNRTIPAYASTGWSSVYNDTSTPYQSGEGFSLLAYYGEEGVSKNVMFRFPKADTSYDRSTSALSRTNAGRLLISDLVDRSDPDKDNEESVYKDDGEITISLTQTGNNYYVIGNPFTAPLRMSKFMERNPQFSGYWFEATYGPIVGNGDNNSWGTTDALVEPYKAFFVTTDTDEMVSPTADAPVTVTFTKDMQDIDLSTTRLNHYVALSVRAENAVGVTGAALSYLDSAEDSYSPTEDVVLMEDITWQRDGMPLVYTVASDVAVSVNKVNSMPYVPLGVFADDDCAYTLTFMGTEALNEPTLYDAETKSETPLNEGYTLNLTGSSHGRYFIHSAGAATDIATVENITYDINAYSPVERTVIVSSSAEIESIEVYSISGMLQKKVGVGNSLACTIEGVSSGIAVVRAHTAEGTFVKKIMVK